MGNFLVVHETPGPWVSGGPTLIGLIGLDYTELKTGKEPVLVRVFRRSFLACLDNERQNRERSAADRVHRTTVNSRPRR